MIVCTKCKISKTETSFGKYSGKKNGLRSQCKQCRSEEYASDIENQRKIRREYEARNKDKARERHARWAQDNPIRLFAYQHVYRNNEDNRLRKAKLLKENRVVATTRERERYALKLRAIPIWFDAKAVQDFYETSHALGMWTGEWYEVDHIVPLKSKFVCGLHVAANMQILTSYENISKGNRWWPQMWD